MFDSNNIKQLEHSRGGLAIKGLMESKQSGFLSRHQLDALTKALEAATVSDDILVFYLPCPFFNEKIVSLQKQKPRFDLYFTVEK